MRDRVAFRNDVLDDFVLLRADGLPTYNFACVVDDHEMAISHVIRGDDHISNTPRQIALYDALGWEPPVFAHVSMILGERRLAPLEAPRRHVGGGLPRAGLPAGRDGELPGAAGLGLRRQDRAVHARRAGAGLPPGAGEPQPGGLQPREAGVAERSAPEAPVRGRAHGAGHALPRRARLRPVAAPGRVVDGAGAHARRPAAHAGRRRRPSGPSRCEDALETEPAAWAELLEKPAVGPRLEQLAAALEADPEFSLESLERATRGLAAAQGVKPGELMAAARVALTGPQDRAGPVRGDVAAGPGAGGGAAAGRGRALGGGVGSGAGLRRRRPGAALSGTAALGYSSCRIASIARWCNGSTTGSGPVSRGSNPCRAAILRHARCGGARSRGRALRSPMDGCAAGRALDALVTGG